MKKQRFEKGLEKQNGSTSSLNVSKKTRTPIDYDSRFWRNYRKKENAIPDVARAMFHLNRYCKSSSCPSTARSEIYALKEKLIRRLYELGFCHNVFLIESDLKERVCNSCGGSGESFFYRHGRHCPSCGGTGKLLRPCSTTLYDFSFEIGNELFVWHLPENQVKFKVRINQFILPSAMKDIRANGLRPLPRIYLRTARALIRWFLSENRNQSNAARASPQ